MVNSLVDLHPSKVWWNPTPNRHQPCGAIANGSFFFNFSDRSLLEKGLGERDLDRNRFRSVFSADVKQILGDIFLQEALQVVELEQPVE